LVLSHFISNQSQFDNPVVMQHVSAYGYQLLFMQ